MNKKKIDFISKINNKFSEYKISVLKNNKLIFKNSKEYKESKIYKKYLTLKKLFKYKKKPKWKRFPLFFDDTIYMSNLKLLTYKKKRKLKEDLDLSTDEELLIKTEKYIVNSLKIIKKKFIKNLKKQKKLQKIKYFFN